MKLIVLEILNKPLTKILLFSFIYLFLHFIIRVSLSDTLQLDDAEQIRLAQELKLGYPIPQPPLYSWLAFVIFKIFDESVFSISLIKYLLIFFNSIYIILFANEAFSNNHLKKIFPLFFLLLPSYAWHMHQGFTHTIILSLSISMVIYYLNRIFNERKKIDFFLLGIAIGIGMLSKYSFIIFLIISIITLITSKKLREFLFHEYFIISLLTAILISLPHYLWVIENISEISSSVEKKLQIAYETNLHLAINSLFVLTKSSLGFILPSLYILVIFFKEVFKKNKESDIPTYFIFFRNFYIIFLIIFLFFITLSPMPEFKVRWLHPVMMIFPYFISAKISLSKKSTYLMYRKVLIYTLIFTSFIAVIRIGQLTLGDKFGYFGRINRPLNISIASIPKHLTDFPIATNDAFIGAHLLMSFPGKSLYINGKNYREYSTSQANRCLWVWSSEGPQHNPKIAAPVLKGKISSKITQFNYTLFYSLDKKKCN